MDHEFSRLVPRPGPVLPDRPGSEVPSCGYRCQACGCRANVHIQDRLGRGSAQYRAEVLDVGGGSGRRLIDVEQPQPYPGQHLLGGREVDPVWTVAREVAHDQSNRSAIRHAAGCQLGCLATVTTSAPAGPSRATDGGIVPEPPLVLAAIEFGRVSVAVMFAVGVP